jgi:membrane protein DedA with SNARE-associated domain
VGENFQALVEWLGSYGYPILFALVFAESAGLPLPGETAVLAASVLASRPEARLAIGWVIVVVIAAAVLGDNLGFWVGHRWARPRLRAGKRFLFLTPQAFQVVEGYFEHYGSFTVAISRFVAGLRVVAALAAGTSGMPWPRFLLANLTGAIAWGVAMSLLGYFFGQSWEMLHKWMGRGAVVIVGSVVVIVGLPYLLRRFRHLPALSWNHMLRARIWEGFVAALLVVICVAVLVMQAEHAARTARAESADRQVEQWVEQRAGSPLDTMAMAASYAGSLPVAIAVVGVMLAWSHRAGRGWREQAVILWALAGSEAVGLALLALIRHTGNEPARAQAWPFGFAGLAPLRAAAVFGMVAQVTRRLAPQRGLTAMIAAACAILLTGFSVVWTREQRLTEVAVEYAAGGLVLFVGVWWLEGYGPGPLPVPPHQDGSGGAGQPASTAGERT